MAPNAMLVNKKKAQFLFSGSIQVVGGFFIRVLHPDK
jgi:hypothetical protein